MNDSVKCGLKRNYSCRIHFPLSNLQLTTYPSQFPRVYPEYYGVRSNGKKVPFTMRSAPVGYAAEYLTRGEFPALTMGLTLLMFMLILYQIW